MSRAPILTLRVSHAYYKDGRCPELAIVPSATTAGLLRKHRCHLQYGISQLTLFTDVGASGAPLFPLPAGASLRFSIEAASEDVLFITDLSGLLALPSPLFTTAGMAAGAAGELALVDGPAGAAGRRPGALADVEIIVTEDAAAAPPALATFFAPLPAKRAYWAYYCVTDVSDAASALHIVDEAPAQAGQPLVFRDEDRRKLNDAPDPSDRVGSSLVLQSPGMACVRFLSSEPVACNEEPRRHLALRLGDEKVSSPLPNPSSRRPYRIDMPIDGGAAAPRELFAHILEYYNHTTKPSN